MDRVTYKARVADRAPGETARQRLGVVPIVRSMPALFDDPPRWFDFHDLSRAEARRLGRYWNLALEMRDGRLTPEDFQHTVLSWRHFRDERLLADPTAVLEFLDRRRAHGEEPFYYFRSRRP